jgi:hypothetical protein
VSAVTTEFTLADLERMPEDGMQREILYGELIQLLPPHLRHEVIAARINESLVISNQGRDGVHVGHGLSSFE